MSKFALCDGSLVDLGSLTFSMEIDVIAHHLSKIGRYNGALPLNTRYSVAEHSINLANYFLTNTEIHECLYQYKNVSPHFCAFYALIHDASEVVLGDIVSGLKKQLPEYIKIEQKVQDLMVRRHFPELFSSIYPDRVVDAVKKADTAIVVDEVQTMVPNLLHIYRKECPEPGLGCRVDYNGTPQSVKTSFLKLYNELKEAL